MTTKKISLNTWGRNYVVVSAGQGEVNSRFLQITIVDDASSMNLTNTQVILYAVKPDDSVIYNNCTIEDATQMIVSIELTSQMSSTPGVLTCELHVIGSSQEVLKIVGLEIVILECSDTSKSVESTSEFTCLSTALNEVETLQSKYQALISSSLNYNYLGVCPVSSGGTGASSLTSGGIVMGNGTSAVTTVSTLPVSSGGTGATTATAALTNLGIPYETGTWTPVLRTSTGGYVTATYTEQLGTYVKVGQLIYITFTIYCAITDVGTGNPMVGGLPYSSKNTAFVRYGLSTVYTTSITSSTLPLVGQIDYGSTFITLFQSNGYNNAVLITGSNQLLSYSGCYMTA